MSEVRLIDANTLREQIDNYNYFYSSFEKMTVAEFLTLVHEFIDNAPTVSFAISPDYVTELQNLNKELTKQLEETERPRGIWIEDKFGDHFCSNCKTSAFYNEAGLEAETRFCPTCGADMRGGAE